ncbi:hypothetical protein H8356DRAFT_1285487 [Neocallimastix lanati (nom. inval.)]|uniref:Histone deacetylase complex subunit SAP30 Sin3 binding domain-containing protein n=1 Tax=Neocallimastix californiae TaxID=1754190 RepID=A0A1Y2FTH8_9FUNG|nr:hypothetical protein H8356DRAFT_1285487 [Neocallimastix sp. JGI-2020a]ORY86496.1 hypothetical protein LY90DRAFT_663144 [Neocallimastix californiae]|eukprot:ORY86496.1 hypothetical protein LY90DRAFT_663144 [Neocallimastix californiae]
MGSKKNNHNSNSLYSNNSSNRQSGHSNSGNNNGNSIYSNNNTPSQANGNNSNSSNHSLKHNSNKDKISKRNKKVLSIVFDPLNSSSNNGDNVTKINLSTFNTSILRKYKDTYKIKTKLNSSREDLLNAVTKHWNSQDLSEKDIITQFIYTVKNHGNLLKLPLNAVIKASLSKSKDLNSNNN